VKTMADPTLRDSIVQLIGLPNNFAGEVILYTGMFLLLLALSSGMMIAILDFSDSVINRIFNR